MYETVYERSRKNMFWLIKNSGEVLCKLKLRGFRATYLSTYDCSTLFTCVVQFRPCCQVWGLGPLDLTH